MTQQRDASASVKIAAVLLVPAALAAGWYLFPGDAPPEMARPDRERTPADQDDDRDPAASDDDAPHDPRGEQQIDPPRIARSVAQAGNYTYVELFENENETLWIAAPQFEAKVGDRIVFVPAMEQRDFHSPTLGRTFDRLIFASAAQAVNTPGGAPNSDSTAGGNAAADGGMPKLEPPQGGLAIAAVFADRQKLNGQTVKVRGTITKVNLGILGANWYHLRDGSGDHTSGDLTFTSQQELKLGQVVTLHGKLAVDHALSGDHRFALFVSEPEIVVTAAEPLDAP